MVAAEWIRHTQAVSIGAIAASNDRIMQAGKDLQKVGSPNHVLSLSRWSTFVHSYWLAEHALTLLVPIATISTVVIFVVSLAQTPLPSQPTSMGENIEPKPLGITISYIVQFAIGIFLHSIGQRTHQDGYTFELRAGRVFQVLLKQSGSSQIFLDENIVISVVCMCPRKHGHCTWGVVFTRGRRNIEP
jgi:hypothetical protein